MGGRISWIGGFFSSPWQGEVNASAVESSLQRPGLAVFVALAVPCGTGLGKLHAEGPLSENKPELRSGAAQAPVGPLLTDDLERVPEVSLQPAAVRGSSVEANRRQLAQQFARAREGNARKLDGFMEALLGQRSDLAGLPFVLGKDAEPTAHAWRKLLGQAAAGRSGETP